MFRAALGAAAGVAGKAAKAGAVAASRAAGAAAVPETTKKRNLLLDVFSEVSGGRP